jgi:8-oxo-dGTP diphosphatase
LSDIGPIKTSARGRAKRGFRFRRSNSARCLQDASGIEPVRGLPCASAVESPPVPVVCAVIERAGRVLLAQRPPHKLLPLKWEFAGGKVEPGEDPAAAIVREIREELGVGIRVLRALPRFTHDYGRVVIEMIPFVCALSDPAAEPHAHEHIALAWVRPEEFSGYNLAAADRPVVAAYRPGRR